MLSTARKIHIARLVATLLLRTGINPIRRVSRGGGIEYELDLREGIDLSIFLLGSFQRHVLNTIRRYVPVNGCVIDVGANMGAVTLPAAAHVRDGYVYAVEPTDFAYEKLLRNISLNDQLASRIFPIKSFLAESSSDTTELVAWSSWPVVDQSAEHVHPIHLGVPKSTYCGQMTLDDLIVSRRIPKVDFIKIDTDGHEFIVLSGASDCLARDKPVLLFEACEYLMRPPAPTFDDFAELLSPHGYVIRSSTTNKAIDSSEFYKLCPKNGSIDVLATCLPD